MTDRSSLFLTPFYPDPPGTYIREVELCAAVNGVRHVFGLALLLPGLEVLDTHGVEVGHQAGVVDHVGARVAQLEQPVERLARAHSLGDLHLQRRGLHERLVHLPHGDAQQRREEEAESTHFFLQSPDAWGVW